MNKTKYERKHNKGYNYCRGIKCDDIKPMERKFFKYMVRQINYEYIEDNGIDSGIALTKSMDFYVTCFSEKYNVSVHQLKYWLDKWKRRDVFKYDESTDTLYFVIDGVKYTPYSDMIPQRVSKKVLPMYIRHLLYVKE